MPKLNPQNERLKVDWIKELNRDDSPSTVDHKLAALAAYEEATDYINFDAITEKAVDDFIAAVLQRPTRSRTKAAMINSVKGFFNWMVLDERLKGKQARKPIKALRLPKKERTAGQATKRKDFPTVAQITKTIAAMPKNTAIDRRNRALMAFTLLSGARDGAIVSMRLKHVDVDEKEIFQDPNEVDTKASKQINTWFFPVGAVILDEVLDYIAYLQSDLGFGPDDFLFPSTARGHDENDQFCVAGLTRKRWASAQPMRDIFKAEFQANGFKYYNPHSFRNTLMALAYELRLDGEALKAWSQNLGHEKLDTSVNSYGPVTVDRQKARMLALHKKKSDIPTPPPFDMSLLSNMVEDAVSKALKNGI